MADRYLHWTNTRPGRLLARRLGLPRPIPSLFELGRPHALHRWSPERPVLGGDLLHRTPVPPRGGDSVGGSDAHAKQLAAALDGVGLPVRTDAAGAEPGARFAAVVVDATGIRDVPELRRVHESLHPVLRSVASCGRGVVLGSPLGA